MECPAPTGKGGAASPSSSSRKAAAETAVSALPHAAWRAASSACLRRRSSACWAATSWRLLPAVTSDRCEPSPLASASSALVGRVSVGSASRSSCCSLLASSADDPPRPGSRCRSRSGSSETGGACGCPAAPCSPAASRALRCRLTSSSCCTALRCWLDLKPPCRQSAFRSWKDIFRPQVHGSTWHLSRACTDDGLGSPSEPSPTRRRLSSLPRSPWLRPSASLPPPAASPSSPAQLRPRCFSPRPGPASSSGGAGGHSAAGHPPLVPLAR